jgi:CheY-like chemotaxis protein
MTQTPHESRTPHRFKILWADDDTELQVALGRAIRRRLEVDLLVCGDGAEAAEKGEAFLPDLIISDGDMPRMNGIEACKAIRKTSWGSQIPIIFHTGLNLLPNEVAGYGFTAYVKKFEQDLIEALKKFQIPSEERPEGFLKSLICRLAGLCKKNLRA